MDQAQVARFIQDALTSIKNAQATPSNSEAIIMQLSAVIDSLQCAIECAEDEE